MEISFKLNEDMSFLQKDFSCPGSDREHSVSPFGFDTVGMSSNLNENMSSLQGDLLCPDSDRECSVSPLKIRYSGDKL